MKRILLLTCLVLWLIPAQEAWAAHLKGVHVCLYTTYNAHDGGCRASARVPARGAGTILTLGTPGKTYFTGNHLPVILEVKKSAGVFQPVGACDVLANTHWAEAIYTLPAIFHCVSTTIQSGKSYRITAYEPGKPRNILLGSAEFQVN